MAIQIHIILPPLAKIRTVVERMAKLSPIIGFSAQAEGNLKVEIATDSVAVETIWQNCPLPQIAGEYAGDAHTPEGIR